jgi:hypothetical protein
MEGYLARITKKGYRPFDTINESWRHSASPPPPSGLPDEIWLLYSFRLLHPKVLLSFDF